MVTYEGHSNIFSNKLAKDDENEPDVWQSYHWECVPVLTKRMREVTK